MTKSVKYIVYTNAYGKACHLVYNITFKNEVDVDDNVQSINPISLKEICLNNVMESVVIKLTFYNGKTYDNVISTYNNDDFVGILNKTPDNEVSTLLETYATYDAERWLDMNELFDEDYALIARLEKLYKEKGMEEVYRMMWSLRQGVKFSASCMINNYLEQSGY